MEGELHRIAGALEAIAWALWLMLLLKPMHK